MLTRPRHEVLLGAGALVLIAGGLAWYGQDASHGSDPQAAAAQPSTAPEAVSGPVRVSGTLTVPGARLTDRPRPGGPCVTAGGYSDVTEGATVRVLGLDGAVLGWSRLDAGITDPAASTDLGAAFGCQFPFNVSLDDAPGGDVQVEVGRRGAVPVDEADLGQPLALRLA